MMPEDPPEFEHADHPKIWKQLDRNAGAIEEIRDKVHENSETIGMLNESMDWVKRILSGVFVAICITLISLIISML